MALRCVDPENPDAGAVVDHNWIDRLEKNTLQRRPTPVELRGLANGLDLDPKVVTAAAAAQYFEAGTPQESTDDVVTISDPTGEISALVHAYTRLTGQDRPKIFDLMDELNSQQGKGGSADSAKSDGS
jgi:hypothetical protein